MAELPILTERPLMCPSCATTYPLSERFCPSCHVPLVYSGSLGVDQQVSERQERARKVKPQYAEGELVRVAGASSQPEAEFVQGLLLEQGVPSLVRRARGADAPDFMAAGRRDILVPASGADVARQVLLQGQTATGEPGSGRPGGPLRLLLGLVAALALGAVLIWLVTQL